MGAAGPGAGAGHVLPPRVCTGLASTCGRLGCGVRGHACVGAVPPSATPVARRSPSTPAPRCAGTVSEWLLPPSAPCGAGAASRGPLVQLAETPVPWTVGCGASRRHCAVSDGSPVPGPLAGPSLAGPQQPWSAVTAGPLPPPAPLPQGGAPSPETRCIVAPVPGRGAGPRAPGGAACLSAGGERGCLDSDPSPPVGRVCLSSGRVSPWQIHRGARTEQGGQASRQGG